MKVNITIELDTVEPDDRELLDKLMEFFETRGEIVHDARSKSEEAPCFVCPPRSVTDLLPPATPTPM